MKSLTIVLALVFSTSLLANDAKWSCTKDGKEVVVKGDTAAKKKAACEEMKGQWAEEKAKEQAAGKSGGW